MTVDCGVIRLPKRQFHVNTVNTGVITLPPLDGYSNIFAAYSMRLLRSAYAGSAIRVRESSGNTEADIGFSGGNLNTTALAAHVGSNSGYITKWYDQSGGGLDVAQATTTAQPRIVNAGTNETIATGKVSPLYDGTDDSLSRASVNTSGATGWSMALIVKRGALGACLFGHDVGVTNRGVAFFTTASTFADWIAGDTLYYGAGYDSASLPRFIGTGPVSSTDSAPVLWDGTLSASNFATRRNSAALTARAGNVGTVSTSTATLYIATDTGTFLNGYYPEMILFSADKEASTPGLPALRQNMTSYWAVV